jgi:drug/metabolite transporter (DMT)-like permease
MRTHIRPGVRRPVGLIAAAAVSWGLGVVMTKVALDQLEPLDVLGVELVVGAAAVWGALLIRGSGGAGAFTDWRAFALLGLLEPGLSFALGDFGLDKTGAADGALLIASETLFVVVLARLVLTERLTQRTGFAVAAGALGSAAIGLGAVGDGQTTLLGDLLVLGGTAAAAAYSVLARRVARDTEPDGLTVTAVQLLVAATVCLPLVLLGAASGHSHFADADAAHLLAGVATGLLTTGIPFLLYNIAIRDVDAAPAAVVLNLVPIIAAVLATVLLDERLGALQILGGVAVIAAALTVDVADPDECSAFTQLALSGDS